MRLTKKQKGAVEAFSSGRIKAECEYQMKRLQGKYRSEIPHYSALKKIKK